MRRIVGRYQLLVLLFFFSLVANGQLGETEQRTLNLGAIVQTKTIGIDFKLAKKVNEKYSKIYDLDLVSLKHPKEQKVTNTRFERGGPFVFGKLNHFHALRLGYGLKKTLGKRVSRNTIGVSVIGVIGLDIGILKPVYLELVNDDSLSTEAKVDPYDPAIHNSTNIVGGAGYLYGFDKIQIKPGAYGKVGLEFGWGNYNTSYMVVEVGATLDVFLKEIPIMNIAQNKSMFSGFYISFALAKIY